MRVARSTARPPISPRATLSASWLASTCLIGISLKLISARSASIFAASERSFATPALLNPAVFSSIDMKTIILILATIATTTFAICLDAQGQRLSLPEGQADSQIPLPAQFRVRVEKGIITLRDVNSGKVLGRTTFEGLGVVTPTQDKLRHVGVGSAS